MYYGKAMQRTLRLCTALAAAGSLGTAGCENFSATEAIDFSVRDQADIAASATHFNPVDLVCGIRDYKGNKFDLSQYVDPLTGFISQKSQGGRDLKALELPGLWNGSMSDWITIFVEVPIETFNPVKVVNDLLRPQHQP